MSLFGNPFKSIGKAIGSVAKTAASIAVGGATGALNVAATTLVNATRPVGPSVLPVGAVSLVPNGPDRGGSGFGIQLPSIGPGGVSLGGFEAFTNANTVPSPAQQTAMRAAGCSLTKAGKVRRTKKNGECFKTPSMNPLNGKALRRSMRRIEGFKRAANIASRITIRAKNCK